MDSSYSLKILIIEDNYDYVFLLSSLLESMGHSCIAAYDGAEGMTKAIEAKPDVIFCDIGLPGIDGYEVIKNIREIDSFKGVCIIALTGYAGPDDVHISVESGFDFHVAKPTQLETIKNILSIIQEQLSEGA